MIWLMEILKVYLEQLLLNYHVINHLILQKIKKYDGYQCGLTSMVYKFFHRKTSGGAIKSKIMQSEKLAKELTIK